MKRCSKCRRWVPVLLGLLWAPGYGGMSFAWLAAGYMFTGMTSILGSPGAVRGTHEVPLPYIPAKGRPEEGIRANHPRANLPQPLLRVDVG